MTIFGLSSLTILITNTALAVFLLLRSRGQKLALLWGIFCITIAFWGLGGLKFSLAKTKEEACFWWQVAYIGPILAPAVYCHFVVNLLKLKKRVLLIIIYFLSFVTLGINFFANELFLGDFRYVFNQFYWHDWFKNKNIIFLLWYILIYSGVVGYFMFLLVKRYRQSSGFLKNQLKYCILGSIIGWLGPIGDYLVVFRIDIYPYSNFFIGIYTFIILYAITKYRLMDVTLTLTRAGIFIFIYTLILGIPFVIAVNYRIWLVDLFGMYWWMAPLGLMGLLATFGPYLYIYLERRAEGRLLKEQRLYQQTLKQASTGMTRIRNLRKLLNLIAHIVTSTVKISYIAVYLYDEQTNEYVLHVSRDKGRTSVSKLSNDNFLVQWLIRNHDVLIYEEVKRRFQDTNFEGYKYIEEEMKALTAAVIIPSFLEDKFMGLFVLGDKLSGQMYTTDDLNVFQVLASQAALAIENARFYEEAKEMHEQISQAEKMATIGTMADGLSHQLNNRFYALSLIAGNTIDTIKLTDTSKCTPEVSHMIHEINHALGRIQSNVIQGGEVVRGLLKYSRRDEVGFEAIELNAILNNSVEMVQYKIKLSEIDITRDFTELPKIRGNMVQLEEVFFNFIDNAYDSIVERRTILKEEGYRGRVTIAARQKDEEMLEIIVEDNGMGVKIDDAKKVFTPFFTTKTSSRKGTGLGLYVIKRIVIDMHKGKISFESDHKVGTRFILELPLATASDKNPPEADPADNPRNDSG
ncbi:MAG: ATP-binding protein [Candidatus Omnitrophota bacterium]